MSALWDNSKCACVAPDAEECARIRDGRAGYDDDGNPTEARKCQCVCHAIGDDEEPFWETLIGQ